MPTTLASLCPRAAHRLSPSVSPPTQVHTTCPATAWWYANWAMAEWERWVMLAAEVYQWVG